MAEVAEMLRLNQQTVRNWIDQGSLPAVRIGRRVRIRRVDLDRILAQGYQGTAPPPPPTAGPSAEDFWSGEPVGAADPAPARAGQGEHQAAAEQLADRDSAGSRTADDG